MRFKLRMTKQIFVYYIDEYYRLVYVDILTNSQQAKIITLRKEDFNSTITDASVFYCKGLCQVLIHILCAVFGSCRLQCKPFPFQTFVQGVKQHTKMFKVLLTINMLVCFLSKPLPCRLPWEQWTWFYYLLKHPYKVGQETAAEYLSW